MSRYEEPSYTLIAEQDGYELRRYESYLVAETVVHGAFDDTGNTAFRRLAGYIFGRNAQKVKMNMTVPVTREPAGVGAYRYRFVMESAYSEDDLPTPVDKSIGLVRVPSGVYAATTYRGKSNEAAYRRAEKMLLASLERDGIAVSRQPMSATYNGPFTPPFLRRNEVLAPVEWDDRSVA